MLHPTAKTGMDDENTAVNMAFYHATGSAAQGRLVPP